MRGNEAASAGVVTDSHSVKFTIPMRGNEWLDDEALLVTAVSGKFTIPMRGNEV